MPEGYGWSSKDVSHSPNNRNFTPISYELNILRLALDFRQTARVDWSINFL